VSGLWALDAGINEGGRESVSTDDNGVLRTFETGATRDTSQNKLEPYGFISPLALFRFSLFMHEHRKQSDGSLRSSDNWQKGMPRSVFRNSLARHFMDWWLVSRGQDARFGEDSTEESVLCAILFNVQGLLHELMLERDVKE